MTKLVMNGLEFIAIAGQARRAQSICLRFAMGDQFVDSLARFPIRQFRKQMGQKIAVAEQSAFEFQSGVFKIGQAI